MNARGLKLTFQSDRHAGWKTGATGRWEFPNRWFIVQRTPVVVGVALALFTAGCDWMPGKPQLADRWVPRTAITNFASLYDSECAACHSGDARLAASRPMNDPVYLAMVDRVEFRRVVAEGVVGTAMPAFAESLGGPLTPAQIDLVVDRIFSEWSRPQSFSGVKLPPYRGPPGDPRRGVAAYRTYCAKCHGPDGQGSEKGGSVADARYLALVSNQGLRTAVIAGRVDLGMPDWRGYVPGQPMSDQEISDVVAWLASHRQR